MYIVDELVQPRTLVVRQLPRDTVTAAGVNAHLLLGSHPCLFRLFWKIERRLVRCFRLSAELNPVFLAVSRKLSAVAPVAQVAVGADWTRDRIGAWGNNA